LHEKIPSPGLSEVKQLRMKFSEYPFPQKPSVMTNWIMDNLTRIENELDHDRSLITSIARKGNVILPVGAPIEENQNLSTKYVLDTSSNITTNFIKSTNNISAIEKQYTVDRPQFPYQELSQNTLGLGHDRLTEDSGLGAIIHPAMIAINGNLLASFPLRIAFSYLNQQPGNIQGGDRQIFLEGRTIPLMKGRMLFSLNKPSKSFPGLKLREAAFHLR